MAKTAPTILLAPRADRGDAPRPPAKKAENAPPRQARSLPRRNAYARRSVSRGGIRKSTRFVTIVQPTRSSSKMRIICTNTGNFLSILCTCGTFFNPLICTYDTFFALIICTYNAFFTSFICTKSAFFVKKIGAASKGNHTSDAPPLVFSLRPQDRADTV